MGEWSEILKEMSSEDKKQKIYNNLGILLVIGIIGGTGLLLIKYSDDKKQPIKITEPKQEDQNIQKTADLQGKKVNINTATLEDLDKLTGIGPATAQKILDYRNQNGVFKTLENLKSVSGIGESKFEQMKDEISL